MAPEERAYRYLLRLVPQLPAEEGDLEDTRSSGSLDHVTGWEFVSSRVDEDGDELLVFRRPA